MYKKLWMPPPIEGEYTIVASFSDSESYWPSSAQTAIGVTPAQQAVPTTVPTQVSTNAPTIAQPTTTAAPATPSPVAPGFCIPTETLLIIGAAVIIVIAVVAAAVLLRKRA